MADRRHLKRLKKGVEQWNVWRKKNDMHPDLRSADLCGLNLRRINLSSADLTEANLQHADLTGANLSDAILLKANLESASLREADLSHANLKEAQLQGADVTGAYCYWTEIANVDLTGTKGKEVFELLDAVMPDFTPPLGTPSPATPAIKKLRNPLGLRLFVSYTHSEQELAHQLVKALENEGHECWAYLLEPIAAQEETTLISELLNRIQGSDAVIVVTSNKSIHRPWVNKEIDMATMRLRRVLLVLTEAHGDLVIPAATAHEADVPWIMFESNDAGGTAKSALKRLLKGTAWGGSQKLRWT